MNALGAIPLLPTALHVPLLSTASVVRVDTSWEAIITDVLTHPIQPLTPPQIPQIPPTPPPTLPPTPQLNLSLPILAI